MLLDNIDGMPTSEDPPKPEESPKPQETATRQDLFLPDSKDTSNLEESKGIDELTWEDVLKYNNLSSIKDSP